MSPTRFGRIVDTLPGGLPLAKLPPNVDPEAVIADFLPNLQSLTAAHFTEDGLWRDLFALTGTMRTFHKPIDIITAWNNVTTVHKPSGFALIPGSPRIVQICVRSSWVEARFTFETNGPLRQIASGFLSLIPARRNTWKIWLLRTILEEIEGQPNVDTLLPVNQLTPNGQRDGTTGSPTYDCLVVGAGQAGLSVAGRLAALGVRYLLVDKVRAIGDNWRSRYESCKTIEILLPFERTFTPDFDEYLSKDDVAKGFAAWFKKYGINGWFSTVFESGKWDDGRKVWVVRVVREGKPLRLIVKHLVICTGLGAKTPHWPDFPGKNRFKGPIIHSTDYRDCSEWAGKKGVIVGAGNSAHDVAEDMHNAGMDTTMVQRGPVFVFSRDDYVKSIATFYNDQTPIELADRMQFTSPMAVGRQIAACHFHRLIREEPDFFDSLEKAGFLLDRFGDITYHIHERYGGVYVDVGTSKKICNGQIRMKSDACIACYTEDGLAFSDGSQVKADVIVLATGFKVSNLQDIARYLGEKVAHQVQEVSGINAEGEMRGLCKPIGHPGLWCLGGSFAQARFLSRFIALQIKADLDGQPLPIYSRVLGKSNPNPRPLEEITKELQSEDAN